MPESINQRVAASSPTPKGRQLVALLQAMRADLDALRVQLNTHVHSGVTTGAGNSGAPTTTVASLNTQP